MESGHEIATSAGDRPFRVCLFGASVDTPNMGCRALAASLVGLVLRARPNAEISLLYANRRSHLEEIPVADGATARVRVVNFRLSPRARLQEHLLWILLLAAVQRVAPWPWLRRRIRERNPCLRAIDQADFIADIRGGDSFSDMYGLRRLFVGGAPSLLAFMLRKELVLLPQTYGPYSRFPARVFARYVLARARRIYSRDQESMRVVRDLLGKRAKDADVRFCPDVAFSLEAREPKRFAVAPPLDWEDRSLLVGLNVSGLLYSRENASGSTFGLRCNYGRFIRQLAARLASLPRARVLLVPHTFGECGESDQAACRDVWESCGDQHGDNVHLVTGDYDQNEIKSVIGRCGFFIGSRMHSCIAALSQGVPSIGLGYSRKFLGVFGSLGVGDMVLDLRELSAEELEEECVARLEKRGAQADALRLAVPVIRAELESCFRTELLERPRPAPGTSRPQSVCPE